MNACKRIIVGSISLLIVGLAPIGAALAQIKVTAATPASAYQGTIALDVVVSGSGFDRTAKAQYFVSGTTNAGGVTVRQTTFRSSTELVTTIDVAETADLASFVIVVTLDSGRKGKGTTLFSVKAKTNGPPPPPPPTYPNPFKKKTIIKYCVAFKARVQLTVYNSEGKMIAKLVDEEKTTGTYEIEFNASADLSGENRNLPNGYYFYRMIAGDYSSEKKWFCINNLFGRFNMKNLLQTLFFFFLVTQICFAQWTNIGLQDSSITDLAVVNDVIFVTSDSGGVFRSTDGGYNWSSVSPVGLITSEFFPAHIAISPSSGSVCDTLLLDDGFQYWDLRGAPARCGPGGPAAAVRQRALAPAWHAPRAAFAPRPRRHHHYHQERWQHGRAAPPHHRAERQRRHHRVRA